MNRNGLVDYLSIPKNIFTSFRVRVQNIFLPPMSKFSIKCYFPTIWRYRHSTNRYISFPNNRIIKVFSPIISSVKLLGNMLVTPDRPLIPKFYIFVFDLEFEFDLNGNEYDVYEWWALSFYAIIRSRPRSNFTTETEFPCRGDS